MTSHHWIPKGRLQSGSLSRALSEFDSIDHLITAVWKWPLSYHIYWHKLTDNLPWMASQQPRPKPMGRPSPSSVMWALLQLSSRESTNYLTYLMILFPFRHGVTRASMTFSAPCFESLLLNPSDACFIHDPTRGRWTRHLCMSRNLQRKRWWIMDIYLGLSRAKSFMTRWRRIDEAK